MDEMTAAERERIYQEEAARRRDQGPVEKPGNGMAVAALVLGVVGAVFGLIPLLFFVAFPLGVLAIVFGIAGRRKAKRGASGKGMSTAGVILGVVAFALAIAGIVIVDDAVTDLDEELDEIGEDLEQVGE